MDGNELFKSLLTTVAAKVPGVGDISELLIGVFWPSSDVDPWTAMKDKVEQLIDQKLDQARLDDFKAHIDGLRSALGECQNQTDPKEKQQQLLALESSITQIIPVYVTGDPRTTYHLFWPLAVMHVGVLKAIVDGGGSGADHSRLVSAVRAYCDYANTAVGLIYNDMIGYQMTASIYTETITYWQYTYSLVKTADGSVADSGTLGGNEDTAEPSVWMTNYFNQFSGEWAKIKAEAAPQLEEYRAAIADMSSYLETAKQALPADGTPPEQDLQLFFSADMIKDYLATYRPDSLKVPVLTIPNGYSEAMEPPSGG